MNTVFSELQNRNIGATRIMHLGANHAQGRRDYIENGVKEILWVEAIPQLVDYLKLTLTNSSTDRVLQAVLSNVSNQSVSFNIASNRGMSSSVFDFKHHTAQYPNIHMEGSITLTTKTLNDLFEENQVDFQAYPVMIMDLQGSELRALQGASKIMPHINAVVAEVSCIELYEGAPLETDVDTFLYDQGFEKVVTSYTEYQWGETLYVRSK